MKINPITEIGDFDSGQFNFAELSLGAGVGRVNLSISDDSDYMIRFNWCRFHRYTVLPCCEEWMIESYFKVSEVVHSHELRLFKEKDRLNERAKLDKLKHYVLFLDEHGCHEFYAIDFLVERIG
jgi:hypothetical protein